MSVSGSAPERFSVGGALSLTFAELMRRFFHYLGLMFLVSLPGLAVNLASPIDPNFGASGAPTPEEMAQFWSVFSIHMVVGLFAYGIMIGAMTYSVVSGLRGNDLSLGECLSSGLQVMHYVLVTMVVVGAIIMLGFILFIIPGVIAVLFLYACGAVAAAESAWPGKAISRSAFLTEGYRWTILGLILVQILIGFALLMALSIVALALLGANPAGLTPDSPNMMLYLAVSLIVGLPFNAYFAMLPVSVYYMLSVEKDGRDEGQVAQVFS